MEEDCPPDEVTREYFDGLYFTILANQIRFDAKKYGEESIIKESMLTWI